MRARRTHSIPAPSLFPFLSVLVCVIGVLAFLAVTVSVTSLNRAIEKEEQLAASRREPGVELRIAVGGTGHNKVPVLVECLSHGAKCIPDGPEFEEQREAFITPMGPWNGTPYTDFLSRLEGTPEEEYILFIVRPNGLSVFESLRAITVWRNRQAGSRKPIDYGVELAPNSWNVIIERSE